MISTVSWVYDSRHTIISWMVNVHLMIASFFLIGNWKEGDYGRGVTAGTVVELQ